MVSRGRLKKQNLNLKSTKNKFSCHPHATKPPASSPNEVTKVRPRSVLLPVFMKQRVRLRPLSSCVEPLVCTPQSKSWHFHSSRFKSLIRRWTIVMSSLSVAPKTMWNMYPVAAMWVTEGWTQRQTLEYLCSYDHQKPAFCKSKVFSSVLLSTLVRRQPVKTPVRILFSI